MRKSLNQRRGITGAGEVATCTDANSVAALNRLIAHTIDASAGAASERSPGRPGSKNRWLSGDLVLASESAPPGKARRGRRWRSARNKPASGSRKGQRAARTQPARPPRLGLRSSLTWLLTSALLLATAATAYEMLNPQLAQPGAAEQKATAVAPDTGSVAIGNSAKIETGLAAQVHALREANHSLHDQVAVLRAALTAPVPGTR